MFLRINFYSICFAFGLSIILILAGSRYTDNINYRPYSRNIRNFFRVEDGDYNYYPYIQTNYFDGTPNVDRIINNTRMRIRYELGNFNFTGLGINKLENLLPEVGGKPVISLVISTWRSGTTFLGELLNTMPGTFYHYEPLLRYGITQIRGSPLSFDVLRSLKKMLKCDFSGMNDYFEYGKTHLHQFSHNTRLWDHCRFKKELCFEQDFTEKFCKLFPFQTMKVVRLRLRLIEDILQEKQLNLKVILLVRDPRGVMQSRQHRDFCLSAPDCWQPEYLCADMISDYVAAGRLMKKYPDRVMVLRYEEMALDPYTSTKQIFEFLKLRPTASITEYLNTHTNIEAGGVSSTFRVSREVPFRWKHGLNFSYVDEIQDDSQLIFPWSFWCPWATEVTSFIKRAPARLHSYTEHKHNTPPGRFDFLFFGSTVVGIEILIIIHTHKSRLTLKFS